MLQWAGLRPALGPDEAPAAEAAADEAAAGAACLEGSTVHHSVRLHKGEAEGNTMSCPQLDFSQRLRQRLYVSSTCASVSASKPCSAVFGPMPGKPPAT